MKEKTYEFRLNSNPSKKEIDEALGEVYKLTTENAKRYASQCPLGYEELGSYVFDRVIKMLVKWGGTWESGMINWLGDITWKTTPSYIRRMFATGFIDYTRSVYSEFKHVPTDPQESLYVFERPTLDNERVSVGDIEEVFLHMCSSDRKSLYKTFALDKCAFSDEVRAWFESVCDAPVVDVVSVYELSMNQISEVLAGRLAFRLVDGKVFYNLKVSNDNRRVILRPY